MSADKTYIHPFYGEFNYHNESMVITSYIENIMLISNTIDMVKSLFDILEILPIRPFYSSNPVL